MLADHDADAALALPRINVRAAVRRLALPALVIAAAAAVAIAAGGPVQTFTDAMSRALDADLRWLGVAVVLEVISFGGYVALLWLVAGRATPRLGLRTSAQVTLGGAAATRLLPTGGVGGVALTVWALRRAGLGVADATRTLVTFLVLLYSVFLGAIAVSGTLVALGVGDARVPLALGAIPAAGAALIIGAGLVIGLRSPAQAEPWLPSASSSSSPTGNRARLRGARGIFRAAVSDALAFVRRADPRLLGAPTWWLLDAAVLWAMLHGFGAAPPIAAVVLGYFVGQAANTLPVPGAVSGGMVAMLLAFGTPADLALASVLAYRAVAAWMPAPIGLAAVGALRRTVTRWSSEEGLSSGPPHAAVAPFRNAQAAPAWHYAESAVRVPA